VAHSAEGFTAGFPSDPSRPSIIYGDCREGSEGKGREGKGRFDIFTGQKRKEPAGKGRRAERAGRYPRKKNGVDERIDVYHFLSSTQYATRYYSLLQSSLQKKS
jgi:hypothetical protein